jgi:hypothetical protein
MAHLAHANLTELAFFGGRALILVLAFMTFAWAFGRWRRAAARDTQRLFEQLDVTLHELRGVSDRVHHLETRLNTVHHRIEQDGQRPLVTTGPTGKGYEVAVRLAKNGLGVDELIANCGVARHEAELLVRLHGVPRNESAASSRPSQLTWPTPAPTQNAPAVAPTSKPAVRRRGSLVSVVG